MVVLVPPLPPSPPTSKMGGYLWISMSRIRELFFIPGKTQSHFPRDYIMKTPRQLNIYEENENIKNIKTNCVDTRVSYIQNGLTPWHLFYNYILVIPFYSDLIIKKFYQRLHSEKQPLNLFRKKNITPKNMCLTNEQLQPKWGNNFEFFKNIHKIVLLSNKQLLSNFS